MKQCDFPWRLGAVVLMPSGERAVVVELMRESMLLRYMASDELVEHARGFVAGLPVCGYLPRELLVALLPMECEQLPSRLAEPSFALSADAGRQMAADCWV